MKKNVRNALAISGLALAIGASGLTLTASANTLAERNTRVERHSKIKVTRKKVGSEISLQRHHGIIFGTVASISDNSLTITRGTKTFTINTTNTTKILNKKWAVIALTDIKVGDKIRVLGTLTDGAVAAKTVRDISLQ